LFLKYLIAGGFFLIPLGGIQAGDAVSPGFLEGHLKIVSPKPVELAEASAAKDATVDYAEYPLVILSRVGQKEVVRVTADKDGNYRVVLPPGDYVLDAKGRAPGHVRATPKRFSVVSNQTIHVDFDLDTGIR
jgi:carboxypeptidase family protein